MASQGAGALVTHDTRIVERHFNTVRLRARALAACLQGHALLPRVKDGVAIVIGLSTLETCGVYNIANVLLCNVWNGVHNSPLLYADLLLYGVMVTQMWVDCSF